MKTLEKTEGDQEEAQENNRRCWSERDNGRWLKDPGLLVASVLP